MPNSYIKKLHKETGQSIKALEEYWARAEEITKKKFKKGDNRFYAYLVTIFKNMAGVSKSAESLSAKAKPKPKKPVKGKKKVVIKPKAKVSKKATPKAKGTKKAVKAKPSKKVKADKPTKDFKKIKAEIKKPKEPKEDDSWWFKMSKQAQLKYLKAHPNSKKVQRILKGVNSKKAKERVAAGSNIVKRKSSIFKNLLSKIKWPKLNFKKSEDAEGNDKEKETAIVNEVNSDTKSSSLSNFGKSLTSTLMTVGAIGLLFTPLAPLSAELFNLYLDNKDRRKDSESVVDVAEDYAKFINSQEPDELEQAIKEPESKEPEQKADSTTEVTETTADKEES